MDTIHWLGNIIIINNNNNACEVGLKLDFKGNLYAADDCAYERSLTFITYKYNEGRRIVCGMLAWAMAVIVSVKWRECAWKDDHL